MGEFLYPTHMTNGIISILQMITMAKINRLYGVGLSVAGDRIEDFSFLLFTFPAATTEKLMGTMR
jgi:hypothetical protein